MEQLLKEMENLQICMLKKSEDCPTVLGIRTNEHDQKECNELKEALWWDLIYYEGNQIHSMDTRKPLRPNFRKGGMKKVLEEEIEVKINYVTTAEMRG